MNLITKIFVMIMTLGIYGIIDTYAAQSVKYPIKPITLVTPYATGGTSDAVLFTFNKALSEELGQPIIYEHKPGAFTNIGAEYVAKSKPDGYTILFSAYRLIQNKWFGPYPSIDLLDALTPVNQVMSVGSVISANNNLGANNWDQLMKLTTNKAKKIYIGSTQADIPIARINKASFDTNLVNVPYKGGGPALTDLMGGHIDLMFGFLPAQFGAIKANQIKPIAVTSSKRLSQLPEIKTLIESGVNFTYDGWYGLFVPTGTDSSIIDKIASATKKIMSNPRIQQAFIDAGAEPITSDRSDFVNLIEKENALYQKLSQELPEFVTRVSN